MNSSFHYCACIRTLGNAGEKYIKTLQSLDEQTIQPNKIIIYIAEGYPLPKETIGKEIFVHVKKGFIAQRALDYKEVDTPYMLLLDDDVCFPNNMVEKLANEMAENNGDCIAANTFLNHNMSVKQKIVAAIGFTFPMRTNRWAFRIRKSGAYSYNNNPTQPVYETQSAAGPCSLWKKEAFLAIHFEEELYFDRFRYCLGDDQLMFNKAYQNGERILISYDAECQHLSAKTGHAAENPQKYIELGAISFLIWHRTCLRTSKTKLDCIAAHIMRQMSISLFYIASGIHHLNFLRFVYYIKGVRQGYKMSKSTEYRNLRPFRKKK